MTEEEMLDLMFAIESDDVVEEDDELDMFEFDTTDL